MSRTECIDHTQRCRRLLAMLAVLGSVCGLMLVPAAARAQTSPQTSAKAEPKANPKAERKATAKPKASSEAKTASKAKARPRAAATGPAYATRPEAMAFADDVAERRDLDREWVRQAIGSAHRMPQVERLMSPAPSGTPKNWAAYRARFIEPRRIRAGVAFWQAHESWLARAEAEYGVPAEIIVGIIGVETLYGQHMGSFRVLDALTTLAFDFPASHPRAAERSAYFRRELEQFLSLKNRRDADPMTVLGSYAGAMGMPQFMPGSWVRHAVDFDGDGRIDLFSSAADAIGSVAAYFRAHGWTPGMPTHFAVQFAATQTREQLDELLAPDILPSFRADAMAQRGAVVDAAGQAHTGPLALVQLQNGQAAPSYIAGTENFYAITRYNWSSYYALAVIELGQAVRALRGQ